MRKLLRISAVVLISALSVSGVSAQAKDLPDRLTASDIFNLQFASDPQISPDGTKIVYVRQFSDIMTDRRYSNLWIINFDGSDNRPLTTGNFADTSPRWSPDGSRIAYISDREKPPQIYVRWMDTGQTAKLTNLESRPEQIAWSTDGKQIAFVSQVAAEAPRLARLPAPPEGAKWAEAPRVYDRLRYRFDRLGYFKPGYTQLFIVSAEGGAPRQLTTGNFPHGGAPASAGPPVWTPEGKHLLLAANLRPDFEYNPLDSEIYEISLADGAVRPLTNRKGPDGWPAISPDGKTIAYVGFDERYQGYQVRRLYLMNRDGSNPRVATAKLDRTVEEPCWAPDGSGVYFLYDDLGDTKLAFYALDGTIRQLASHIGSGGSASATGGAFTLARNGAFALTYADPQDAGDIAVGTFQAPAVRVLTALNRELFAQKRPGQVEEIWYPSSLDQRRIQGWIIKPPDFDPSKKYPLILEIHGGPFANYGDRFDTLKQIWAAQGYVVLYTNPRGSTSYGEEFGNLIHHAYPGDDFYDLNSGVDAVIAKGYVDPQNLFVTGGSGGGVLTCWMIGRTPRFRAAASLYPVINWYSWALSSDLPSFGTQYWFPGLPWDQTEHYMKRSVISLVKNVKTPTLLMTGEEDYRTPISEAEQYYAALKLLRVETALVRFPEEPHGLRQRPSHEVAKALYVLGWFDRQRQKTEAAAGK